jgi:hypothetical protein
MDRRLRSEFNAKIAEEANESDGDHEPQSKDVSSDLLLRALYAPGWTAEVKFKKGRLSLRLSGQDWPA